MQERKLNISGINNPRNYKDYKPYEIDTENHYSKFIEWCKDKSRLEEFKNQIPVGNYAIIEIFRIGLKEEKQATVQYLSRKSNAPEFGNREYNEYIYPFAKILSVNEFDEGDFKGIKPGDIYVLPDSIANFDYTQEYLNSLGKEYDNQKLVKTSNINSMELGISALHDKALFKVNKFAKELRPADKFTFRLFLSADFFQNKYILNEN